ncbi:MAG: hypothetical protein ACYTE2_03150 [Planctomycetota bacterium]|jgi:hypothetical protein|nr:hypothetical protein [Planctomycetota bacterium]
MTPPPTSIDLVIRIGDAPPPASAIERWSTATWSHHADPFDGLVELGRRRFEVRAQQNWSADPTTRIAVLVTLREGAAELVAALASHLSSLDLWTSTPEAGLIEIVADDAARSKRLAVPADESSDSERRPASDPSPASRTVSSDEIRMLLGDAEDEADPRKDES